MDASLRSDATSREYEEHRRPVTGMLAKRFPRFDENERLEIYHEAWARALVKRRRGETIESLRAYLVQTAASEAMNAVTRRRPPVPLGPDDPTLIRRADESPAVEDQVVLRDQARIARELIATLDPRQRDLFKLRWDLQLSAGEIRAALDLSPRQYQRLVEEGAEAISARVRELEDGSWSRRQRSLLTACLVTVTAGDETRTGIANEHQRREAQRLLDSDPHVAALYTEVHGALRRAAAILPLPVPIAGSGGLSEWSGLSGWMSDRLAPIVDHLAALADSLRRESAALYLRASDVVSVAGSGAATATAAVAGVAAIGGGAYYAVDQLTEPASPAAAVRPAATGVRAPSPAPVRVSVERDGAGRDGRKRPRVRPAPKRASRRPLRRAPDRPGTARSRGNRPPPIDSPAPPTSSSPPTDAAPAAAPAPPSPPPERASEFDFEN